MKPYTMLLASISICAALLAGCAKKEMIRSEGVASVDSADSIKTSPDTLPGDKETTGREVLTDTTLKEDLPGETVETESQESPLKKVYFGYDSYILTGEARDTLHANYLWLAKNPAAKIRIEGHCDERGSDDYNLALGENRARTAMKYLMTLGISSDRLSTISFGEEKPTVIGHDDTAWVMNRRVEFIVISK